MHNDLFKQIALIIYNAPPLFETIDINDAIKLTVLQNQEEKTVIAI